MENELYDILTYRKSKEYNHEQRQKKPATAYQKMLGAWQIIQSARSRRTGILSV